MKNKSSIYIVLKLSEIAQEGRLILERDRAYVRIIVKGTIVSNYRQGESVNYNHLIRASS